MNHDCSCKEPGRHIIARRQTADGVTVLFWSDGIPTRGFGFAFRGIGPSRWRHLADIDRQASAALAGEIEILDAAEVAAAFQALRRELRADLRHGRTKHRPAAEIRRIIGAALARSGARP